MAHKRKEDPVPGSANRPFSRLGALVRQAGIARQPEETPPEPPAELPPAPFEVEDDDQAFSRAMAEVDRIKWRRDPAPISRTNISVVTDPELEDARLFREAVEGDTTHPILDHPEYIEGWVGLSGRSFLPNLRTGVYSIQGALDLHGMSRAEAKEAVAIFVERMSRVRSCCVKIVHGRGINSPSDQAVLKEFLQRWLATRRLARHVVAYASAPYTDGGVGAVYVLLRHRNLDKP